MKKTLFMCSLVLVLCLSGCDYFTGPTGATGPAGPGTTMTELSHTITTGDEAMLLTGGLAIDDAFFETGVRFETGILFSSTASAEVANTWALLDSQTGFVAFSSGTATIMDVLMVGEIKEGAVLTFYKFEPTT